MKENEVIKKEEKSLISENFINPKRDWAIILISFIVLLLGIIFYDYQFYKKVSNGEMFISVNKEELKLESLNIDELNKVIKYYDEKSKYTSEFKSASSVDPSL